jgi:ABC-type bacteriocin/lantibiotic exporter with double-glycine peptidase domain
VLFVVDPVVGGAVFTTTLVLLGAAGWAARHLQRYEIDNREAFSRTASFLHSALLAIEKIQVAAREERVFAGWADRYAHQRRTDAAALRWRAVVAGFALALQPAALAALGASIALLRTDVELGTFVAASVAVGQFAASAGMLHGAVMSSFQIGSAHRHLRPLLDAPPDVAPGAADPGPLHGRVELREVTFTYPGRGRPVLDRVSIVAEPGEFVAVVGPSGAGKSTLIRLLLGLVPPSSGAVRYDGRDLAELDLRAVRAQLGVVLQLARAVRGSIVDNVVAGAEEVPDERVWEALELAGLADEVRAMPMGLHTMVSEDNASFSGGQIQRLMLARALVKRPPVLVLDEATSALDNITQRTVSDRIAALSVTRIVVAHRLSTIRAADRIYILDGGTVAACGTYTELATTNPLFARLVARQEVN